MKKENNWTGEINTDQAIHLVGTEKMFYTLREIATHYGKTIDWVKKHIQPSLYKYNEKKPLFKVVDIVSETHQFPDVKLEKEDMLKTWVD